MEQSKEKRCSWVKQDNLKYINYHDNEWGVVSHDDKYLFEMLLLESFQAGLSWECILNKREDFRMAFDNFDYEKIMNYDDSKIDKLLSNKKIVRNKLKIKAVINNAKIFVKIRGEYGSFDKYIWSFSNNKILKNKDDKLVTRNYLSDEISCDLYKRGMRFVGSVIIYSYLQAIGIINDHEINCFKY